MVKIATYVIIDLETTGLPREEYNRTRITELSLVAVKRDHVLATGSGATPRVQHKLTLCFNPGRPVAPSCTDVTGLCNFLLEYEPRFNVETFAMINTFLNVLEKPVCLIAYNGNRFDFPILKNHLTKLSVSFSSDLLCADVFYGFINIIEKNENVDSSVTKENGTHTSERNTDDTMLTDIEPKSMQSINETTPKRQMIRNPRPHSISKVRRSFPWSKGTNPKGKYKLQNVYEMICKQAAVDAHRAESDCLFVLQCFVAKASEMVQWIDENCCLFSEVKPMTIGVPIDT
ncbi:three-prime repair exonuclease 1-like [Melitaea cinxia]|uniref:three-prime repair exonuclease 1-like n=1 Tax=Melitaea cinxia TaxID=113334 RepID=UPI001E2704D2|nr:three-prime repair exonuclease 1-like [Melitaea cinxia]